MLSFFRRLTYSLAAKLSGIFICAAALFIWVLWISLDITFERQFSDTVQPYFSKYLISLQKEIGFPPDISVAKDITNNNPVNIVIEAPTYRWSSNNDFIDKPYLDVKIKQVGQKGIISEVGFYKGNFILRTFHQGYITSFIITEKMHNKPHASEILIMTLVVLTFIVLLYIVIYYLFHPVKKIQQGIKKIGEGEVDYRLNINRNDEIGALSNSINKMADNIIDMLEAKQQLLLAISHELRTPITRAKIALSMMPDSSGKNSVAEDMQEMEDLIKELLESEKLRGNHAPLEINTVDINDIIYQVQGKFFEDEAILLKLTEPLPPVDIDAGRIGLAIKNLIKNALTARVKPTDSITVKTVQSYDTITVSVIDQGIGIAAEKIPHLTEPFYRTDKSRQRKTGGFGIGLYLIKAITDAHNAELIIDSRLNQGTTVSIILPLNNQLLTDKLN